MSYILREKSESNEDLFIATVNLLTSAANYQVETICSEFNNYKFTCSDTIFSLSGVYFHFFVNANFSHSDFQ